MKLRVTTFNIQHGSNYNLPGDVIDLPLMARTAASTGASVYGFNEIRRGSGEDPALARSVAARFARSRGLSEGAMAASLEKLRSAGLQLSSGELGLVRDRNGRRWDADTVNALFDALESALS